MGTHCRPVEAAPPRESPSPPIENPQGESFVDRPTSNSSSEGAETMPGKSYAEERNFGLVGYAVLAPDVTDRPGE